MQSEAWLAVNVNYVIWMWNLLNQLYILAIISENVNGTTFIAI